MAQSAQPLLIFVAFLAGLGLAGIVVFLWLRSRTNSSAPDLESQTTLPLLEAMETIASAPVERQGLADAVILSAERVFAFDAIQFGVFESSHFVALKRIRQGTELESERRPVGIEEQGLASWSLRHGAARVFARADVALESGDAPTFEGEALLDRGEALVVPVHGQDRPLGMLCLESLDPSTYTERDIELAERIASAMAPVMARLHIQSEIEARSTQMVLLSEISRRLISLQPLEERFRLIAPVISQAFDFAKVRLYESNGQVAYLRAVSHDEEDDPTEIRYGDGLVGRAALGRRTIEMREDEVDDPDDTPAQRSNALAVPLSIGDRIFGVLEIVFPDGRMFSGAQIAFAELLASILAIASLEAKNFAQQQEYTWINTVLLEVARHAAQPGDPETALRAVLQLTTLLAGASWAALLLPDEPNDLLHLGPTSGLARAAVEQFSQLTLLPADLDVAEPFSESPEPQTITLPEPIRDIVGEGSAMVFALSDNLRLVGILLVGGPESAGMRGALLTGIAHQISLRIENTRLIEEVAAQRSLERELETARSIQESFLPDSMPEVPGWDVGAIWVAARQVGGDFYDFIPLPDLDGAPRWGIAIADVADKGVPAALFMALCQTLLRSVAPNHLDPARALARLNHLIFSETRPDLFVSVFYAVWEPDTGKITYANGGHNPPLLRAPDGNIRVVTDHGMVLGVDEGAVYSSHALTIPEQGVLLLYTDGVTEANDETGDQFGVENLGKLLGASAPDHDAQGLTHLIANAIADFVPDQEPFDDLTAVVLMHMSPSVDSSQLEPGGGA